MNPLLRLGETLQGLRRVHGYTLSDLSKRCGIPKSTLSRIEKGHDCLVSNLDHIGMAYGLGAGDLLLMAGYTRQPVQNQQQAMARLRRAATRSSMELRQIAQRLSDTAYKIGFINLDDE